MSVWTSTEVLDNTAKALARIRSNRPLVHNITNYVVMNTTANTLLALGASPIMAHALEEVEELTAVASALVLNIGTLSRAWIEAMEVAGAKALAQGVPVVLDPVGAGASRLRTETALRLLQITRPRVVRANASEILALAGGTGGRGVDATHGVDEACVAAINLARRTGAVVAVTGVEDYVTDGHRAIRVANGDAWLGRITGSGCAATAVTGAFLAVEPSALSAAAEALIVFGIAGELAAEGCAGPGSYQVRLLDALATVSPETVRQRGRVRVDEVQ